MLTGLWKIDKQGVRDVAVELLHGGICRVSENVVIGAIRKLDGVLMSKIRTNGNGKCGLHVVFG